MGMNQTSAGFAEIKNLVNTAKWHKEHCRDSECGVSLWMLGMTAKLLVKHCWYSEKAEARRIIAETNWR